MLKNAVLVAKVSVDTAEKELRKESKRVYALKDPVGDVGFVYVSVRQRVHLRCILTNATILFLLPANSGLMSKPANWIKQFKHGANLISLMSKYMDFLLNFSKPDY